MALFTGFLRLASGFTGAGALAEPAAAGGYAPQPLSADITADVLTLAEGITFGPASAPWSVALCAVAAQATGGVLYQATFPTLAVPAGYLLTVPPGAYALSALLLSDSGAAIASDSGMGIIIG